MSEFTRPLLHYLDPAKSWPLCGTLPDVPAWTSDPTEVTCPECLERLAARGPPPLAGPGLDQASGGRA